MFKKYNIYLINSERVWIGIGSNLLNPKKQIKQAMQFLSRLPMTKLIACSSLYRSTPLNNDQSQPDFLNLVVVLDTNLSPDILLEYIHNIETIQGRVRNPLVRWQSRTLDLDILLFGRYVIRTSRLVIPHYDISRREFVIYPLLELDYLLRLPNGTYIKDFVQNVSKNNLICLKF